MIEKKHKRKKGTISEEDVSNILKKYRPTQVLALLQELAQVQEVKRDWNELVKKTTTGITNPREYQMLWRHLAYRDPLIEEFQNGDNKPLDDDSDLEYELEAFPPVSAEASTEAAACVKVMIASGLRSDSNLMNGLTVEAPLTINIPNSQLSSATLDNSQLAGSMNGTNITVPISVQKQPHPTVTSAEGLNVSKANASGNHPARRKRKFWTDEEDNILIAAVQKLGVGSWATFSKDYFNGEITPSQLSQRWNHIKKKANMNGEGGSQDLISAARNAVSLALNMPPIGDKLRTSSLTAASTPNITPINSSLATTVAEPSSPSTHVRTQPQQDSTLTAVQRQGAPGTSSRPRAVPKKPLTTKPCAPIPDSGVHLAAVAAGARIVSPSDAASLLKAAQRKKVIHIIPGVGSKITSSNPLPPNVRYLRTGVTPTPTSTIPPNASRPHLGLGKTSKAVGASSSVQAQIFGNGPKSISDAAVGPPNIPEVKTTEVIISSSSKNLQESKAASAFTDNGKREESHEKKVDLLANLKTEPVKEDQASPKCRISSVLNSKENKEKVEMKQPNGNVNHPVPMEICEEQKLNVKDDDSIHVVVDGGDAKN